MYGSSGRAVACCVLGQGFACDFCGEPDDCDGARVATIDRETALPRRGRGVWLSAPCLFTSSLCWAASSLSSSLFLFFCNRADFRGDVRGSMVFCSRADSGDRVPCERMCLLFAARRDLCGDCVDGDAAGNAADGDGDGVGEDDESGPSASSTLRIQARTIFVREQSEFLMD